VPRLKTDNQSAKNSSRKTKQRRGNTGLSSPINQQELWQKKQKKTSNKTVMNIRFRKICCFFFPDEYISGHYIRARTETSHSLAVFNYVKD